MVGISRSPTQGCSALMLLLSFILSPAPAVAQDDNYTESYTATTTLFTDLTRTERDSDKDTEAGAGVSADFGAEFISGAHQLSGRYGATLETQNSTFDGGDDDHFSILGSSRYNYYEPGARFDFNAGHSVRSVRNDTGFQLDDFDYDTQNQVSVGSGISFYPGELTTFRVGAQGGKTWEEGDQQDGESVSVDATLSRQVSEQSSAFLAASRAWEYEDNANDITLDSVSVGMESLLHNGSLSLSVGLSRAESEGYENEAIIGSLYRNWVTDLSSTRFAYDRTQSSSLLDVAFAPIPEFGIEDEFSVRYQGVTVRDQVQLVHNTRGVCALCTVNFIAQVAKEDDVANSDETWEYLVGAGLGLALTEVKTLDFDYRWQGDALEEKGTIDDEFHRFIVTYRHRLTERASWGTSVEAAMTDDGLSDEERYRAKLFVSLGWDSMDREW